MSMPFGTLDELLKGQDGVQTTVQPPSSGPFADMKARVKWTRRFILLYNTTLFVLLLLIFVIRKIRYYTTKSPDGCPQVIQVKDQYGGGSDSSSTLTGTATPPDVKKNDEHVNEHSALLPQRYRGERFSSWSRVIAPCRAFLIYQPRPIAFINKVLPNNGTSLAVVFFLGLNVFFSTFNIPFQSRMLMVYSDRCAALFAANLPILYLLAAKNQPIKRLTGYSYEALNIFHRRLGELLCFLALFHMVTTFTFFFAVVRPMFGISFLRFICNKLVYCGIGAFVCYETLYFTSLASFRQRWYELFLASHIVLQIGGLVFLWFHYFTSRPYVIISLGIFMVDRLLYRIYWKSANITARLRVLEDGETVLLSADWAISNHKTRLFAKKSILHGWLPADHVFVSIPVLSKIAILQAHPFTIASAAPDLSSEQPYAWFSLLIRSHAGFSKSLLEYAYESSSVNIRLDGPYGSSKPLQCLEIADLSVVVAGGSGIAVCFPLLWSLLKPSKLDGEDESMALRRSRRSKRQVCLIWIVHSSSHLSWLPQEQLAELKEWGLDVRIPPPAAEHGRPDVGAMVEELAHTYSERLLDSGRVGVVVSGPDGLNRDVRNACSRLVRSGVDVNIEVEKFGW